MCFQARTVPQSPCLHPGPWFQRPQAPHGLCFAPPAPPPPPRVRRKVGVSCAGGAQEGEREVRGTQAGARGQLALVPSMAWGRVGVGLSTGQQTPPASPVSPAAAQERHTGFRGLGVRPQGQLLPTGEVACSPSPVLEGWVCSGKVTWLLPAAPGQQAPWGGPSPPLGCTHLSPGHPPPQLLEGQSGTVCTTRGSRATAQLLTSLHCPLSPRERVCQTNPDPQAHTGLSPAWPGTPQQGSKASKEPRCRSPL